MLARPKGKTFLSLKVFTDRRQRLGPFVVTEKYGVATQLNFVCASGSRFHRGFSDGAVWRNSFISILAWRTPYRSLLPLSAQLLNPERDSHVSSHSINIPVSTALGQSFLVSVRQTPLGSWKESGTRNPGDIRVSG